METEKDKNKTGKQRDSRGGQDKLSLYLPSQGLADLCRLTFVNTEETSYTVAHTQ